jgi:DNA helicase-2/ATP-dependent DNA helicase PcrA
METIIKELNQQQKEAVEHIDGPMLILAGAGSGKTKTITARLAYLISIGIDPINTLTLTFTNKASKEMRERAMSLIPPTSTPPLLATFHKFGLMFLKFHIDKLGRENSFVVIDTDDKKRILKSFNSELNIGVVANEISTYKNSLIEPAEAISRAQISLYEQIANIYQEYQNYLQTNNLVDFDDLLTLTYKILDSDNVLAKETSDKYRYIMVDEYQDTNEIQYRLLKKLLYSHDNLCVVGDDDQSIYGWRGANIDNILNFEKDFQNVKVVKLQNNYRSTSNILKVANELIEHNRNRIGKKLISVKGDGKDIVVLDSANETEESKKIATNIKTLISKGVDYNDIAILFRINALSRSIEEGLNKESIPYKLLGGFRFYERTEVKDLISYFRVISNLDNDFSLKRIINKPKRGIGRATVAKLENVAESNNTSIAKYLAKTTKKALTELVGAKNAKSLKDFIKELINLQELSSEATMKFLDRFEEAIDFKKSFVNQFDEMERVANIDEFYGYFKDYVIKNPLNTLEDFLNDLSLQSDQDMIDASNVTLMSIHASKGLEFKHVFIIGLEEGFFPIVGDGTDLEEERRLGYVAFTRAMDSLYLGFVKSRLFRGRRTDLLKSRFLTECGAIKGSLQINKTNSTYKKGDLVKHKIFGMGRVEEVSKSGKDYKLKINFGGTKRDILSSFVQNI